MNAVERWCAWPATPSGPSRIPSSDYYARHIRFFEMKFAGEDWVKVHADPPIWLCQQTNAKSGERGIRELNGLICPLSRMVRPNPIGG